MNIRHIRLGARQSTNAKPDGPASARQAAFLRCANDGVGFTDDLTLVDKIDTHTHICLYWRQNCVFIPCLKARYAIAERFRLAQRRSNTDPT